MIETSDTNLIEIINQLDLPLKGVKIKTTKPPEIGRKHSGEYSFLSRKITIRKEIIP